MIDLFYKFKYGISNLIKWFPIIWKDRNYDHHFIDVILYHKLKHTYKVLNESRVDWKVEPKSLKSLRICILILERRVNEWHWNLPTLPVELVEPKIECEFKLFIKLYSKYHQTWWC